MRHHIWSLAALVGFGLLAAAPALAQGVDHRLQRQAYHIENGIATGALTPREVRSLWREQQRLQRLTARLAGDGRLSYHESRLLDQRLDQAEARLGVLQHNPNRGYGYSVRRRPLGHDRWDAPRHHGRQGHARSWP